jgi:hypothetical protein
MNFNIILILYCCAIKASQPKPTLLKRFRRSLSRGWNDLTSCRPGSRRRDPSDEYIRNAESSQKALNERVSRKTSNVLSSLPPSNPASNIRVSRKTSNALESLPPRDPEAKKSSKELTPHDNYSKSQNPILKRSSSTSSKVHSNPIAANDNLKNIPIAPNISGLNTSKIPLSQELINAKSNLKSKREITPEIQPSKVDNATELKAQLNAQFDNMILKNNMNLNEYNGFCNEYDSYNSFERECNEAYEIHKAIDNATQNQPQNIISYRPDEQEYLSMVNKDYNDSAQFNQKVEIANIPKSQLTQSFLRKNVLKTLGSSNGNQMDPSKEKNFDKKTINEFFDSESQTSKNGYNNDSDDSDGWD